MFCGFRFPDSNLLSVDVNPNTTINITFHSDGDQNYQGFALDVKFVERTTGFVNSFVVVCQVREISAQLIASQIY